MLPDFNPSTLAKAAQRDDLIQKTAAQIIKDFAEFGLEVTFSGKTDQFYPELFQQLYLLVEELLANDNNRFLAMLYRIDISNSDLDNYKQIMPQSTHAEVVTVVVIHRELKKVMTREYFKHHRP
jgi:hypothetical protein